MAGKVIASIRVEGLGKRYRIGQRERYYALRDELGRSLTAPFRLLRRGRRSSGNPSSNHIWALKDVSFEVQRGEVLGVIGGNGAGKSTLLKILSRITEPTEGRAELHGRVGSLLEVGTGFHPELTGRENTFLSGAILGMSKDEVARKFDQIVEFSGVDTFIDTPVKRYSSGMYVRLAFAVAAHLNPEILLVDEVLAVGDAAFQEKCLGKMSEVATGGRTVLFVSHNMAAVRRLCSMALLLDGGNVACHGSVAETIGAYLATVRAGGTEAIPLGERRNRPGNGQVRVVKFEARASGNESTLQTGCEAEFIMGYAADTEKTLPRLHVAIVVVDLNGAPVFACTTTMTSLRDFRDVAPRGDVVCRIKNLPLVPGRYSVNVMVKDDHGLADLVDMAARFNVIDGGRSGFVEIPSQDGWGVSVVVPHTWEWAPVEALSRRT